MKDLTTTEEKVNEGVRVRDVPLCALCRNRGVVLYQDLQDRLFGAPGTWSLLNCKNCGLVWLNPQPVSQDIGKLYLTYFTHNRGDGHVPRLARVRRLIKNSVLATHMGYTGLAGGVIPRFVGYFFSRVGPIRETVELSIGGLPGQDRGRLLDVGCGSGRFLATMRSLGWEVMGVEPDSEAVEVARAKFGLNVFHGTLEEACLQSGYFDAITMNHVIEHLADPVGTLKECHRVLKPRGKLVIVTPNIASLGHKMFTRSWRGLEPPRHLYLFSPAALSACSERAGLKVLQLRTTSRLARWIWAASHAIQRNDGPQAIEHRPWVRLTGIAFHAVEYGLCRLRDAGEEIVLVAGK